MSPTQLTTAISIARQLARRFAHGDAVWAEDLEQEAMTRVCRYADRFDSAKGSWEDFVRLRSVAAIRLARRRRQDVHGPVHRRFVQTQVISSTVGHPGASNEVVDLFDSLPSADVPADRVAEAREQLERIVDHLSTEGVKLLLKPVWQTAADRGVSHQAASLWRQKAVERARKATR